MVFLGVMLVMLLTAAVGAVVCGRREAEKLRRDFAREDKQRDAWS